VNGRLPTFIGIGAAKCGTGSIHRYLGEHPEIFVSPIKETNFFAYEGQREHRFRVRSWAAYRRLFTGATAEAAIGEFSPQYMNYPRSAPRIAEALPDVKLVVSLRSPADRAYSAWAGRVCSGVEQRPAELALTAGNPYIDDGLYGDRLRPYLERFPRERIKIVVFEDFAADPARTMAELYAFLSADQDFVPDTSVRVGQVSLPRYPRINLAWQTLRRLQPYWFKAPAPVVRWHRALLQRSLVDAPPCARALRARLLDFYAPEVGRMEELMARDLSIWRC
jgi:hypothetical protein